MRKNFNPHSVRLDYFVSFFFSYKGGRKANAKLILKREGSGSKMLFFSTTRPLLLPNCPFSFNRIAQKLVYVTTQARPLQVVLVKAAYYADQHCLIYFQSELEVLLIFENYAIFLQVCFSKKHKTHEFIVNKAWYFLHFELYTCSNIQHRINYCV